MPQNDGPNLKKTTDKGATPKKAPFPSKEEILRFITETPGVVGKREIARAFHIQNDDRILLKAILKEMTDEGMLHRGHKKAVHKGGELPKVAVVEVTGRDKDGHAVVKLDQWQGHQPLILLQEDRRFGALGIGDRALARIERISAAVHEARVMRRLEAGTPPFMGRFNLVKSRDGGMEGRITPVDKKLRAEFQVAEEHWNGAKNGELVLAEEVRGRGRLGLRPARVRECLGSLDAPRSISLIAIHSHDIPVDFDPAAVHEARNAKPAPLDGRTDLRHIPLITVDPSDARDHDDAIWAEADSDPNNPGGWHVIVAIADVGHYVRPGSALDRDARKRGNSVYFPDRVVPMLPEELSTDLCSLKPGVERATLAVHMWFDRDGNKIRHNFARAVMKSAANLAYEVFQAAYDGHGTDATDALLESVIRPLYGAYFAVEAERQRRGALELEMPERKIRLDPQGRVIDVRERERLDAHKLVENFMIAANVAAAETLEKHRELCMYRVHDEPSPEKIDALRDFLESLNIRLAKGQVLSPALFNRVLERAKDSPESHVINQVVLRSQMQAIYSPENLGHFGLGLRRYAHFTSPIRRYSDILVHRGLISSLGFGPDGLSAEDRSRFAETGEWISATERRAMAAERDSNDRYLAAFLSERVGASFTGRISSVTRFGLFISLDDNGADGLVPISSLRGDYYHLDDNRHSLTGERTGRIYRIGDPVTVALVEATPLTGGIRLELLEDFTSDKKLRRNARVIRDKNNRKSAKGGVKSGVKSGKKAGRRRG